MQTKSSRRRWVFAIGSLPVVAFAMIVLLRPEQVSQRFLRTGGRSIQFMTDNVRAIAVVGAIAVLLLWLVIGWIAIRENRKDSNATGE